LLQNMYDENVRGQNLVSLIYLHLIWFIKKSNRPFVVSYLQQLKNTAPLAHHSSAITNWGWNHNLSKCQGHLYHQWGKNGLCYISL
jgi:hypothetical protein